MTRRKVQLVITSGLPVQVILCHYYTTAVTNFISWNKAYSIFPRATFLLYETIPLKPVDDAFGRLHAKYSQRGWRMRTEPVPFSHEGDLHASGDRRQPLGDVSKHGGYRRIGDRDSWVMRLGDTAGVEGSSHFVPDSVLEYSGFQIRGVPEGFQDFASMADWDSVRRALCVTIRATIFQSPVLRHQYLEGFHALWREIRTLTTQDTIGQLCKFSSSRLDALVAGRPPVTLDHNGLNAISFDHPLGWDYMDDAIPRLYDEWESQGRLS